MDACFPLTLSGVKMVICWHTQNQTHHPFGNSDFVVVAPPPKKAFAGRPGRPLRTKMRPPSLLRPIISRWLTETVGLWFEPVISKPIDSREHISPLTLSNKPRAPRPQRNDSQESLTALHSRIRSFMKDAQETDVRLLLAFSHNATGYMKHWMASKDRTSYLRTSATI